MSTNVKFICSITLSKSLSRPGHCWRNVRSMIRPLLAECSVASLYQHQATVVQSIINTRDHHKFQIITVSVCGSMDIVRQFPVSLITRYHSLNKSVGLSAPFISAHSRRQSIWREHEHSRRKATLVHEKFSKSLELKNCLRILECFFLFLSAEKTTCWNTSCSPLLSRAEHST